MRYFLSGSCALKWLEEPSVYNISTDELYELDETAFEFLRKCADIEGGDGELCDTEFLDYAVNEGLLTLNNADIKRPAVKKSVVPSLRYLELQINRRCNLKCKHCYIGMQEAIELSIKDIELILAEFEAMQGLRLLLTGGEPLLHREFAQINKILTDYAFRKILFTNGLLLTRNILETLNVDELQISVDGLESGHEALRGKGTFRKTIKAIKMAVKAGFSVSVSTMIHSKNLEEFDGMEGLFTGLGIKDWSVDIPCADGNLKGNPMFQLKPGIAGKYLRYGFGEGLHGGGEGFACGLHLASVLADRKVAKCAFYKDSPAGVIDEGLETCWKRIAPIRLADLKCDCTFLDTCRGGCRYRAELLEGNLGKDTFRCYAMIEET